MKKEYLEPEMEISYFENKDMITTSPVTSTKEDEGNETDIVNPDA